VSEPGDSSEQLQALNLVLEQRVEARTRELAAAVRELEAFAFSVSHDLRSPLRAIEGFSDELLRSYGSSLDERGRHYLSRIQHGSRRMAALIDDLLKLSRLTRDAMTVERCDLSALVRTIGAELAELEPARRVELVVKPGLAAYADPRLLRIALENLLRNAWKFTSRVESARVEFGTAVDRGVEAYFVRDNGAGFDMTFSRHLFGAFQRLHGESEFPGTGVGLATVQRVIRRHGGEVWAEGRIGEGATFFFTLPSTREDR
jgi:light-regulated signal transduction histidine kinase (bacteriophytochrome)